MYTLGINAAFHDSSACLVKDGELVAAAEEERFTRIKHGKRPIPFSTYKLPFHAIDYCLNEANLHISNVDHVAYSFDPWLLIDRNKFNQTITLPLEPSANHRKTASDWPSVWDPLFLSSIVNAPRHLKSGFPHYLQHRFNGQVSHQAQWHFVEHHLCHAASSFHASPFSNAAVLTVDGRGEKVTTAYHTGTGHSLARIAQIEMPNSLGLLYETITDHLGFLRSSDEYKVMALASFGKPVYLNTFRQLFKMADDGKYQLKEFNPEKLFGPARSKDDPLKQKHFDLARSAQDFLEEAVLQMIDWLHSHTRLDNLCLAGGVALNCVLNSTIINKGPFKKVWVQPASGDSGTALGAALWIDGQQAKNKSKKRWEMEHAYWGPGYSQEEIERYLKWTKTTYRRLEDPCKEAAALLAKNKIIGWFQGQMEFGPRALGNRSILASPAQSSMQRKLNEVKKREHFRPVAPAVLEEDASEWFEISSPSPFMLFVYNVKPDKRGRIPAACHVDGTARVQTVNTKQNKRFHHLLTEFKSLTGLPVLINTSFNVRGEPVVCSPQDALSSFWTAPLDALIIESFLVEKRK